MFHIKLIILPLRIINVSVIEYFWWCLMVGKEKRANNMSLFFMFSLYILNFIDALNFLRFLNAVTAFLNQQ